MTSIRDLQRQADDRARASRRLGYSELGGPFLIERTELLDSGAIIHYRDGYGNVRTVEIEE